MSDTPLTDAAKIACGFQAVPESFFQHACQLERKNAVLRSDLLIEEERSIYWRDNEGKAMAENAALWADKERVMELIRLWETQWPTYPNTTEGAYGAAAVRCCIRELRAAIDAARKEEQP